MHDRGGGGGGGGRGAHNKTWPRSRGGQAEDGPRGTVAAALMQLLSRILSIPLWGCVMTKRGEGSFKLRESKV